MPPSPTTPATVVIFHYVRFLKAHPTWSLTIPVIWHSLFLWASCSTHRVKNVFHMFNIIHITVLRLLLPTTSSEHRNGPSCFIFSIHIAKTKQWMQFCSYIFVCFYLVTWYIARKILIGILYSHAIFMHSSKELREQTVGQAVLVEVEISARQKKLKALL